MAAAKWNGFDNGDIVLDVGGETFRVHRAIIAAASPVCKTLLDGALLGEGASAESTANTIVLDGDDPHVARYCILLMYTMISSDEDDYGSHGKRLFDAASLEDRREIPKGASGALDDFVHKYDLRGVKRFLEHERGVTEMIRRLEAKVDSKERQVQDLEEDVDSRERQVQDLEEELHSRGRQVQYLEDELESRERRVQDPRGEAGTLERHVQDLEGDLRSREHQVQNLEREAASLGRHVQDLERERDSHERKAQDLEHDVQRLNGMVKRLKREARKEATEPGGLVDIFEYRPPVGTRVGDNRRAKPGEIICNCSKKGTEICVRWDDGEVSERVWCGINGRWELRYI